MSGRGFQTRSGATLGDAFKAANPELAQGLASFASAGRRDRDPPRRRDERGRGPGGHHGQRNQRHDHRRPERRDERRGERAPIVPRNADPANAPGAEKAARDYCNAKRNSETARRLRWAVWRRHELDREDERRDGRAVPQQHVKHLGRLVILANIDAPCNTMIAAAWPGDHSGLVGAYLDSDLFNEYGWFFEPDAANAIDIASFGAELQVFTRDGAWTFRSKVTKPQSVGGRAWSNLRVGPSILHRRFKTDIEEGRKSAPNPAERAAVIPVAGTKT